MAPSDAPPIVVSYRSLSRIVNGPESAQDATHQAAKEVTASPLEQAMLLAQFGEALRELEDASKASNPEVMINGTEPDCLAAPELCRKEGRGGRRGR